MFKFEAKNSTHVIHMRGEGNSTGGEWEFCKGERNFLWGGAAEEAGGGGPERPDFMKNIVQFFQQTSLYLEDFYNSRRCSRIMIFAFPCSE